VRGLLSFIARVPLCRESRVPFGLHVMGMDRGLTTLLGCLSCLLADLSVRRIVPFPARLFFQEVLVFPGVGAANALRGAIAPIPAFFWLLPSRLRGGFCRIVMTASYQDPVARGGSCL
jgi:hypothetical protein